MPNHNNFHAHIVWADRPHCHINGHLAEHLTRFSNEGRTVTCYIAAEAGRFFASTWWYNGRKSSTAQSYTAEFIRDGESVHHGIFDRRTAATLRGIGGEWLPVIEEEDEDEDEENHTYYFMFRSMDVSSAVFYYSLAYKD